MIAALQKPVMVKKIHCLVHVMLITFLLSTFQSNGQPIDKVESLEKGTLQSADIDSTQFSELMQEISTGKYNIHSLLILRNNKLVCENYFKGSDELLAVPLGIREHSRDSLHDCRSLTKSIVSCCIGIAIANKKIKSINDKALSYLPKYGRYDTGMKHDITIRDLLTMSAGIEWNENIPYSNPNNSEIQMLGQQDVVDFVLSRPNKTKPGTTWNYRAACTQLLAEILQQTTGEKIDSFASKHVFEPLGIKHFYWYERGDGTPWAPSGLRLRPIDIAKFGLLYLNNGKWNNEQILSPDWVHQSLHWQINARNTLHGYGYQFWVNKTNVANKETEVAVAVGFGGQRIYLVPDFNMEIVVTAGNYNDLSDLPDEIVFKHIFPAIKR
jgi:CubicO group peptidase (beta-lactamase class C family)